MGIYCGGDAPVINKAQEEEHESDIRGVPPPEDFTPCNPCEEQIQDAVRRNLKTVADTPFDQIISHQAVYTEKEQSPAQKILPFEAPIVDALYDANGYCFVALTEDGLMWTSRLKHANRGDEGVAEMLDNPYNDWVKVYDFSYLITGDDSSSGLSFTKLPDSIAIASSSQLIEIVMDFTCTSLTSMQLRTSPSTSAWGKVTALTSTSDGLWLGADVGGLRYMDTSLVASPAEEGYWLEHQITDIPSNSTVVSMLWAASWDIMFVSTSDVFYELRFQSVTSASTAAVVAHKYTVRPEWVEGNLDSVVGDMLYDTAADCLWAVERDAVHKRLSDGSWWRAGLYQGASTDNITKIALDGYSVSEDGYLWVGTADRGVIRMLKTVTGESGGEWRGGSDPITTTTDDDDWLKWQLYYGPRYTPDGAVQFLLSDAENSKHSGNTLVVTDTGVTILTTATWTLGKKAEVMQSFQYPRHDRNGIVAEVSLRYYGDLSSYTYNTEDSDSIWTGQYAAAASMRYAITGDEEDRKSAWRTFEALEMLGNVTGIDGLVGRSMCSPAERTGGSEHPTNGCGDPSEEGNNWYASNTMPGYVWKGDTSSDTVDGHYFAYGLVLDLVAETPEEKNRAVNVIDRLTTYIVRNNLYYVDITGEPTKWGRWNPADLNMDPMYVSERGGNSLEILGFLALAYSVTEKQIYFETFQDLAHSNGYFENILNQKIDNPYDDNHSDNELSFLAYHTLFYAYYRLTASKDPVDPELLLQLKEMVAPVIPSITRFYSIVRNERSPLWIAGVAGVAGVSMSQRELERSVSSLQMYSADLINWGVRNSGRWDCILQPYYSRDDPTQLQMTEIRPPQERIMGHWNSNPFTMDSAYDSTTAYNAGGGYTEYSPAEWLLPYWMFRFYELLE